MASLANDVLAGLTRGIRFNKKRNATALEVLGRKPASLGTAAAAAVDGKDPLDFFGTAASASASTEAATKPAASAASKKRARSQVELSNSRKGHSNSEHDSDGAINESQSDSDSDSDSDRDSDTGSVSGRQRASGKTVRPGSSSGSGESGANAVRKQLRIKVKGNAVPAPMTEFSALKDPVVERNIESSKYVEPTPIQMQSIPVLNAGRDMLACAPTGSGKTAAFLLPIIARLSANKGKKDRKRGAGIRAVVIAPTRELAAQIFREYERLSRSKHLRGLLLQKATVGNVAAGLSGKDNSGGIDLLVATPLRFVRLLQEVGTIADVEMLVLDEADRLFELGFVEQIDEIIAACGEQAQRAMLSATMPQKIEDMAQTVLRDPVQITVGIRGAGASTIEQKMVFVGQEQGKPIAVRQLAVSGDLTPPTLVFVQSKERAQELYEELAYEGLKVEAMHAERTQGQRDDIVRRFRRGEIWILICTDLMGRGIDFKGVNCVINYDLPTSPVAYIHRIGRTGRANRKGKAFTLFTLEDTERLRSIANVVRLSGGEVPDWMTKLPKASKSGSSVRPAKRAKISTVTKFDQEQAARRRNMIRKQKRKDALDRGEPVEDKRRGGKGSQTKPAKATASVKSAPAKGKTGLDTPKPAKMKTAGAQKAPKASLNKVRKSA